MTTTPAPSAGLALPQASTRSGSGVAPLRDNGWKMLQTVLFVAGAILMPLGIVVIVLGYYGAANTAYQYDQISYLLSGGLLGLGLTFCGGFLYFGAWLARIASDQREASKRLADTLLVLADVTSRAASGQAGTSAAAVAGGAAAVDAASLPVTAPGGTTMHRRDCSLVAHRDDLQPVGAESGHLTPCRLCQPGAR